MKSLKHKMVETQLLKRGINNSRILEAFLIIDREDFIQPKYKKYAYIDLDVPLKFSRSFVLRPYFLARIVLKIVNYSPNNVLIIGDESGYTISIMKNIYGEACVSINEDEISSYREKKFDLIFFDSKVYGQDIINASKVLLNESGKIIYMSFQEYEKFSFQREDWHVIEVLERSYTGTPVKLFSWNMLLKEK